MLASDIVVIAVGASITIIIGLVARSVQWGMRRAIQDVVKETLMKPNGGNSLSDIRGILDKQTIAQKVIEEQLKMNQKSHANLASRIEGISRHLTQLETRFTEYFKD